MYISGKLPTLIPTAGLRTLGLRALSAHKSSPKTYPDPPPHQETVVDKSKEESFITDGTSYPNSCVLLSFKMLIISFKFLFCAEVISKVNSQIQGKGHGRLFAVVHLLNRQWKITPEDIIIAEGYWPPNVGDTIRLEKVCILCIIEAY